MTHGIASAQAENVENGRAYPTMPPTTPASFGSEPCFTPTIPGYEILGEIGRGGMGVVYKALQTSLQRFVALKVVIGGAFAGPIERARFRMEAEALARLRHSNIVQVYDVGEHDGVAYIAFEFVDGTTLRRWQGGEPIEPRVAARFAAAIARAVQHAHEIGIVHRDLKPANILLGGARPRVCSLHFNRDVPSTPDASVEPPAHAMTPKVSDFGLAKPIEGAAALTMSGVTCGTPNYMAPEQVRGGKGASLPPVDVWGLGAILFELLTGRPPFEGPDATAIMQEIALSDPPAVRSFAPSVPRDLTVIVGKCMEKNPAARYVSAGELADDLERYLAGEPIKARPIGVFRSARRWIRRNPIPTLVGLFLIVALAGVSAAAAALSASAKRERTAREGEHAALLEEGRLRKKADEAKTDAEKARDDKQAALLRVEQALGQARAEKERAEKNLTIARQAVKHVLSMTANLTETDDPALFPVYRNLLAGLAPFAAEIIAQKSGDHELKHDQAEMSRALGVLESLQGRPTVSRDHFLASVARLRELAEAEPANPRYQLELARALGFAASVGVQVQASDTKKDFAEARAILDKYLLERPNDVEGLNEMIRVRLSMIAFPGSNEYTDENDRAVLDLIERLVALRGQSPQLRKLRAHALNNIASDLTNRGKTDEAESLWLNVLRIREELSKSLPGDRITQYELGKCLANYANQLAKTGRAEQALGARSALRVYSTRSTTTRGTGRPTCKSCWT